MPKPCVVDECGRWSIGQGLCGKHYQRWLKYGSTELPTTLDRLRKYFTETDGCWLWTGAPDGKGYGAVYYDGRAQRAHRAVYMEMVGPIPDGLVLDHLCRTPACVRPDHLEPVTPAVNRARGLDLNWRKKAQTHCKNGHPFEGRNLIMRKKGGRDCRECMNAAQRRYQAKKRVA